MRRLFIVSFFLAISMPHVFCQRFYVKASSNYNISASTQQMPEYFTFLIYFPSFYDHPPMTVNLGVNEFTVSSGLNFQGSAGYRITDVFSLELKFSTFGNSKKEFNASPKLQYGANGKTEWQFRNVSVLPTLMFGQTAGKSTINIFVYAGLGTSKLNIKASMGDEFREYEFDKSYTVSVGYGLEYGYALSKKVSVFTNIGIDNTNYKPVGAKVISSLYPMKYLTTSQLEIKYVDEINNLKLDYYGLPYPDKPEVRLKETLRLNSLFCGVGLKYTFKK